jgi:hypothetical protein
MIFEEVYIGVISVVFILAFIFIVAEYMNLPASIDYSPAYPKIQENISSASLHVQLSREENLEREVNNLREKITAYERVIASYERDMGKQGAYR